MLSTGANFILGKPSEEQDLGFSLLEMLIALSVISLTSLALFQSIGTMLNVSAVSYTHLTLPTTPYV